MDDFEFCRNFKLDFCWSVCFVAGWLYPALLDYVLGTQKILNYSKGNLNNEIGAYIF